ncbi:restriction endonuclease subunit S [Xanthomonas oryzae]|uniref:restriction endonuclease subunit S n=1 Tax=Xanthomonas oryzae TaxID=347 RepID=UPI000421D86D|nr:restriction endonuclease subunit S [Xanthomonas oryzae]
MSFTANLDEIIDENRNGQLGSHLSWSRVQLADVAEVLNGFPFDSDRFNAEAGHPVIRIRDVVRGTTRTFYSGAAPEGFWIDKGEILIGMDGDFNAAIWKSSRALLNQRVLRLKSQDDTMYDGRFLFHVIGGYLQAINAHTSSVTVKHLSSKTVLSIPLPLPPIEEQKRIAQKLDALLAQVDTLKARIDAIPALLKRFRKSVIHSAVIGRLSADLRVPIEKSEEQEQLGPLELWREVALASLGELSRGKSKHRPRNDSRLYGSAYPFIQTGDVANSRGTLTSSKVFYSEFGLKQSRLFPSGTLCITIAANIADTAMLAIDACFPDSVVGFIPNKDDCVAQFIKYVIDDNKESLEALAPATAQKNINLKVLNQVKLRIPPIKEQTEIVRRVEQLFAYADQLEAKVAAAQKRINALTQSLLAKAFRGELVPQDPSDEPASVLLDRIRAQRAAAPKPKRGRKAATS